MTAWALLVLAVLAPLRLAQYVHTPVGAGTVRVEIPAGAGGGTVARLLTEAGLGSWEQGTRLGLRVWGRPDRLKAGTYSFAAPVRLVDVFADLEAGRVELVAVTLPEGSNLREIAAALESAGILEAEPFLRLARDPEAPARWGLPGPTLEGYLFPDTYRFARGLEPETVAEALILRFREVTAPLTAEAEAAGLDLGAWVTLASIVEKETGAPEERSLVSAVFHNRLTRGMRLQSDPTVIYGVEGLEGRLRRVHLQTDTPYNTYTRPGLPPGPIASPGRASLEAALRPAPVPFLFFVSRNDGTHVFSITYDEHRQHVLRHQGGGGGR
ncbi:MAG: endolytic transglycosylase MltG [Deferrisomatales bacterium]|nr:endolytic transglycosylase MltG [Deferrisomatales bacterium]